MNAKKIMGAVLVALLAAALFVGAGAAGSVGTYFAYQNETGLGDSVWQNGANTVTVTNGVVGSVAAAGTYTKVGDEETTAYFTKPTATYSAIGNLDGIKYIIENGGTAYKGSELNISVISLNITVPVDNISVTYPSGSVETLAVTAFTNEVVNEAGLYKIQAIWKNASNFTEGAPLPAFDANVFTFTVVDPTDATISASTDTVYADGVITVTIKGTPGEYYNLTLTEITASAQTANQIVDLAVGDGDDDLYFQMPNIGEATFRLKVDADAEEEVKVVLGQTDDENIDEVVIAVVNPTLTATVNAASYFVGNTITLTLSSDVALVDGQYNFTISGTNFKETLLNQSDSGNVEYDSSKSTEKTLVYKIKTVNLREADIVGNESDEEGKTLDVGTYTIKIYKGVLDVEDNAVKTKNLKKSVSVALKQPFISIGEAPEVIAQGEKAEFIINAEATNEIAAYVFGTNFFMNFTKDDGIKQDGKVKNQFTLTIADTETKNMSAGQYFAVFQHPMYDTFFNIASNGTKIVLNETADAFKNEYVVLFNVNDRQTANAAQALCDALDSQNIDDMYVKYSFFVVGKDAAFTISEIPTTVAQGETITISGVSTAAAGDAVVVEMISTAFAAVPKETVGSAAFIAVTTEVAEDGTWEVTLDTSDLNVDEYSLSVVCEGQTWKSVNINVVEAADEPETPDTPDVPDTPDTPDTPTEPETPGFGALAALAGLGAVAVLLLRRE